MKKLKYLAPLLALPLLLLGGCKGSTPALALSANWNKDTTNKGLDGTKNLLETLTYSVSFEGTDDGKYAVHYGEGTYTTRLECRMIEAGEASQYGYYYRTELNIPVWFTVNGAESEKFNDTLVSEAWFLNLNNSLQPVKSTKTANSHTPIGNKPADLNADHYFHYDGNITIDYDNPLSKATINRRYLERYSSQTEAVEKNTENLITKIKSENYFDNEQILFVLRGTDMSASASLKTINPTALHSVSTVRMTAPTKTAYAANFTVNENDAQTKIETNLDAFTTQISYSTGGQAQSITYAAKTDTNNNLYRNVMLQMDVPLSFNLGTLKYTLKTANFYS